MCYYGEGRVKLSVNFMSFCLTDIRSALVGVGLVIKDEKSGLTILDKGAIECGIEPSPDC